MKSCILKKNHHMAGQAFYFTHTSSGDPIFDDEHVRIYLNQDDKNPLMICHISQIVEIPDEECKISFGSRSH